MPNPVHVNVATSLFPAGAQNPGGLATPDQYNDIFRGVRLIVNVTVGGTLTIILQAKDPFSANYVNLLTSAALGVSSVSMVLYPGITPAANLAVADVLPTTWRLSMTVAASAVTATIAAELMV